MLTRIAPTLAVAYWMSTHSAQFGAQMPTRSPLAMPAPSSPRASAVDLGAQLGVGPAAAGRAVDQRLAVGHAGPPSRRGCRRWSPRAAAASVPPDGVRQGGVGGLGCHRRPSGCGAGSAPANTPAGDRGASGGRSGGRRARQAVEHAEQQRLAQRRRAGVEQGVDRCHPAWAGRGCRRCPARPGGGEQPGEPGVVEGRRVDRRRAARPGPGRRPPGRRRGRPPPTRAAPRRARAPTAPWPPTG